MKFEAGTIIGGQYRLTALLGKGAWGEVYKAICTKRDIYIAIKILTLTQSAASPEKIAEYKERFDREIKTALKIHHPSVITVYDFGHDADLSWYVMEYIEGSQTLHDAIKENRIPIKTAQDYALCIIEGIRAIHAIGATHRDIKTRNILVYASPEGPRAKILDLGVVHLENSEITETGVPLCTPRYVAPEYLARIFDSKQPFDQRIDLFSMGVVFYEILTGHMPFDAPTVEESWRKIREYQPPFPSSLRADISQGWDHIVMRCLEKDPTHRFLDASALRTALLQINVLEQYQRTTVHEEPRAGDFSMGSMDFNNSPPQKIPPTLTGSAAHFASAIRGGQKRQPLPNRYKLSLIAAGTFVLMLVVTAALFVANKTNTKTPPVSQIDSRAIEAEELPAVTPRTLTEDATHAKNYQLVHQDPQPSIEAKEQRSDTVSVENPKPTIKSRNVVQAKSNDPVPVSTVVVRAYGAQKSIEIPAKEEPNTAFISAGTSVAARLQTPLQEGSLDQTVTVRLSEPLNTHGVPLPAGLEIIGNATFQHKGKEAFAYLQFSRILMPDGTEKQITAVAAMKDGRIGIPAFLSEKESNVGANVGEAVVDVLEVATGLVPGTRTTGRFIGDERNKAHNMRNDNRPLAELSKNTKLWVVFKQRVAL